MRELEEYLDPNVFNDEEFRFDQSANENVKVDNQSVSGPIGNQVMSSMQNWTHYKNQITTPPTEHVQFNQGIHNPLTVTQKKRNMSKLKTKQSNKSKSKTTNPDMFMVNVKINNGGPPMPAHGYGFNDSRGDLRPT